MRKKYIQESTKILYLDKWDMLVTFITQFTFSRSKLYSYILFIDHLTQNELIIILKSFDKWLHIQMHLLQFY